MRTIGTPIVVLLFKSGLLAQQSSDIGTIRSDLFAVLRGDMERFERVRAMIAANSMYFDQLRGSWKRALGITIGVALASAVVFTTWGSLLERIMYHMIVSLCVGSLFWLNAPALVFRTERLTPFWRWAIRVIGAAITLNVGITIGL